MWAFALIAAVAAACGIASLLISGIGDAYDSNPIATTIWLLASLVSIAVALSLMVGGTLPNWLPALAVGAVAGTYGVIDIFDFPAFDQIEDVLVLCAWLGSFLAGMVWVFAIAGPVAGPVIADLRSEQTPLIGLGLAALGGLMMVIAYFPGAVTAGFESQNHLLFERVAPQVTHFVLALSIIAIAGAALLTDRLPSRPTCLLLAAGYLGWCTFYWVFVSEVLREGVHTSTGLTLNGLAGIAIAIGLVIVARYEPEDAAVEPASAPTASP
jgi:hypothetical protein